ncbi:Heat shock 70 kDa protein 12A [Dissophora globulifera]|nr:Heat shock 70 kDa protein 12A [Dissophora globulifera]
MFLLKKFKKGQKQGAESAAAATSPFTNPTAPAIGTTEGTSEIHVSNDGTLAVPSLSSHRNSGHLDAPAHPQLYANSPFSSSVSVGAAPQLIPTVALTSNSGVGSDPRAPHTLSSNSLASPPSYSSVIPGLGHQQQSSTTAFAPSPSPSFNSPAITNTSMSNTFPSPTPGSSASPQTSYHSNPSSHQNSPMFAMQQSTPQQQPSSPPLSMSPLSTIPYPVPGASVNNSILSHPEMRGSDSQHTYPGLPMTPIPPNGQQQYGHRPYVPPGNENQTYPIIMAIDWGTTYSSMAYAYQQDGEVHEVSTWPKQSHNYPKVPTCNLYAPGSKEILEWGYPAKIAMTKPPFKNHILLSKYKLHLDDSSGPHPPLPNGISVVEAIADYLRLFHAHVLQSALRGFGSAFEPHHIQYCLSVPAMWTDHAKSLMRQAALMAGMITPLDPPHRLLLISEPEAAALYCEKKCDQYAIGNGERFMICDAGGGTVDLIVFEVAVTNMQRSLREVTHGSGHSCGSVFLDERMEALLRRKFSRWGDKGLTPANWVQLMETFIHQVKPLFDGVEDQYINMPAVPGRADLTDYEMGLEDGVLTVTAEEMRREVFDPVVDDVLRLIHHQLQQTQFNCQAIFLVGGFGCSGYLLTRVRSEFSHMVRLIAVPPRAELAVVRGAAIAGIAPRTVAARVVRRWYGVDALVSYEHGIDLVSKRTVDRGGYVRAKDRFSVYATPGQQIGVDECITKRYVTFQYPNPVHSPLYACSSPTLPRYVDSPMVEKIGDFTIPLPFIPGAKPGHKLTFDLRMYFGATEIRAEAEVNGIVVSTRCHFAG